jgi:hypothetical protein
VSASPHEFFAALGFELTFSRRSDDELEKVYVEATAGLSRKARNEVQRALADGRIGPAFADLRAPNGQVLVGYGTGHDEDEAGTRAVERWKQEQG